MGIVQHDAVLVTRDDGCVLPGFPAGVAYESEPTNRYQRWIRQGMHGADGKEKNVSGHYTKRFGPKLVEA